MGTEQMDHLTEINTIPGLPTSFLSLFLGATNVDWSRKTPHTFEGSDPSI